MASEAQDLLQFPGLLPERLLLLLLPLAPFAGGGHLELEAPGLALQLLPEHDKDVARAAGPLLRSRGLALRIPCSPACRVEPLVGLRELHPQPLLQAQLLLSEEVLVALPDFGLAVCSFLLLPVYVCLEGPSPCSVALPQLSQLCKLMLMTPLTLLGPWAKPRDAWLVPEVVETPEAAEGQATGRHRGLPQVADRGLGGVCGLLRRRHEALGRRGRPLRRGHHH
mmetsp:Transcript_11357/g.30994  ORF Transcript_11357/g.30994 Transcript_11357/m.30994 type:complete len:224 (-) Transcript_11357:1146-1817(-)